MSKTSFKAFCVGFYANDIGKTGPEVYAEFEKSGVIRAPKEVGILVREGGDNGGK